MIIRTEPVAMQRHWCSGPLKSIFKPLREGLRRAAQRRQLAQLSREQLADFGATAADQLAELQKPFWRD